MNLQEHVSNSIQDVWTEWADNHGRIPGSDQLADAAISAMREAMLSDAAILAAAEGLSTFEPGIVWGEVWEERCSDPVAADAADEYYRMAQAAIKAALAAITAPTEDGTG